MSSVATSPNLANPARSRAAGLSRGLQQLPGFGRDALRRCLQEGLPELGGRLTKLLFRLDLGLPQKLHVLGFIGELVEISDRAEDLADRIALVIAERVI